MAGFALAGACLLGSVWAELPFHRVFPDGFNRFCVAWWFLALLSCAIASCVSGIVLILCDRRVSWRSRLTWTLFAIVAPPGLLAYWLGRIEWSGFRARRIMLA